MKKQKKKAVYGKWDENVIRYVRNRPSFSPEMLL